MSVEKELKNTLHNLEFDSQKTMKTIELINSLLTDQYEEYNRLITEIIIAKDLLKVLNQEKSPS